jgi:hypothetical protein
MSNQDGSDSSSEPRENQATPATSTTDEVTPTFGRRLSELSARSGDNRRRGLGASVERALLIRYVTLQAIKDADLREALRDELSRLGRSQDAHPDQAADGAPALEQIFDWLKDVAARRDQDGDVDPRNEEMATATRARLVKVTRDLFDAEDKIRTLENRFGSLPDLWTIRPLTEQQETAVRAAIRVALGPDDMTHEHVAPMAPILAWLSAIAEFPGSQPEAAKLAGDAIARLVDLRAELDVTDELLEQTRRVIRKIPECNVHGDLCLANAWDWIDRTSRSMSDLATILGVRPGQLLADRAKEVVEERDKIRRALSDFEDRLDGVLQKVGLPIADRELSSAEATVALSRATKRALDELDDPNRRTADEAAKS